MLDEFWRKSLPFNGIRLFYSMYAVVLVLVILFQFRDQYRFFVNKPRISDWIPGLFPVPALRTTGFVLSGISLCISLMLGLFGYLPRLFLVVSIVCYFLYFGQILDLAYIRKKSNIIPFILTILLVSPGLDKPLSEATPIWPVTLVKIQIALVYLGGAYSKLSESGLSWVKGEYLQSNLMTHYLWGDMPVAKYIAGFPRVCTLLNAVTLLFEGTFLLALHPRLAPLYVVTGLGFHAGTAVAMRIEYLKYFCPAYLVFVAEWIGPVLA